MTRSGIRMKASGVFPLEDALEKAMDLAEVRLNLFPLQGSAKRKTDEISGPAKSNESGDMKELKRQLQSMSDRNASTSKRDAGPVCKVTKGEGKGKGKRARMPKDLIGVEAS